MLTQHSLHLFQFNQQRIPISMFTCSERMMQLCDAFPVPGLDSRSQLVSHCYLNSIKYEECEIALKHGPMPPI